MANDTLLSEQTIETVPATPALPDRDLAYEEWLDDRERCLAHVPPSMDEAEFRRWCEAE